MDVAQMWILYILLGAVAAIIYSLRRVFILENKIIAMDLKIERLLEHLMKKKKR